MAKNAGFTNSAGDQLIKLRAEIDNEYHGFPYYKLKHGRCGHFNVKELRKLLEYVRHNIKCQLYFILSYSIPKAGDGSGGTIDLCWKAVI